jgi:hypothetical protein
MQSIYADSVNRFKVYDQPGNILISKKYYIIDENGGYTNGLVLVQRFNDNLTIQFPNGILVYNQPLFEVDNLIVGVEKDFHNANQINLYFRFEDEGVNARIKFYDGNIIILN